jgi:hypothetical protein
MFPPEAFPPISVVVQKINAKGIKVLELNYSRSLTEAI